MTTHATPAISEEFPVAFAVLICYRDGCFSWRVEKCPVCGGKHTHGAGVGREDPRHFLGHRAGHCFVSNHGYVLVEADPEGTRRALLGRGRLWRERQ